VVSEERGAVSLAFEGGLEMDLSTSVVRERLTDLLIKRPSRLFRRDKAAGGAAGRAGLSTDRKGSPKDGAS
ncbi:MAG: hypothetical protein KC613_12275, partial [Myxococcales bacterium]|nr:hypothetical protein [Myxococcales bacterium]